MADFNVNVAEARGEGARPVAPVMEQNINTTSPYVALGANLIGILGQNLKEKEAKDKEAAKQAVIADFTQKQTTLADAVERGMPPAQAAAMSRANFSKYAANYPALIEDLKKSNVALTENTGLSVAKEEAQNIRDQKKTLVADMVKAGYPINENTPPATLSSWTETYQSTRRAEADLERAIKRQNFSNSKSSEERSAFQFDLKNSMSVALTEVGSQHLQSAQLFISDTLKQSQGGDVNGALLKVNNYFSNVQGAIAAITAHDPGMASNWNKLFSDLHQTAKDGIEGKVAADVVETRLKTMKNTAQLMALNNNPKMQGLYAVSALTNGNLASLYVTSNKIALDTLTVFGGEVEGKQMPPLVGNADVEKDVFSMVKEQVKVLENGKASVPEETKKQLSVLSNRAMKQVAQGISNRFTSKDLKESANFFASPEYAKIISYGLIDKQQASDAKQVFSVIYNKDVVNGIGQELNKTLDFRGETSPIPYKNLVAFEWAGAGVNVTSTYDKYVNPTEKQNRDQIVREMQVATKGINQLVHMGTHMEGHTNYAKFWEENKHSILPEIYPDPSVLKPGQVIDGYRYLGGNTKSKTSWKKVPSNE